MKKSQKKWVKSRGSERESHWLNIDTWREQPWRYINPLSLTCSHAWIYTQWHQHATACRVCSCERGVNLGVAELWMRGTANKMGNSFSSGCYKLRWTRGGLESMGFMSWTDVYGGNFKGKVRCIHASRGTNYWYTGISNKFRVNVHKTAQNQCQSHWFLMSRKSSVIARTRTNTASSETQHLLSFQISLFFMSWLLISRGSVERWRSFDTVFCLTDWENIQCVYRSIAFFHLNLSFLWMVMEWHMDLMTSIHPLMLASLKRVQVWVRTSLVTAEFCLWRRSSFIMVLCTTKQITASEDRSQKIWQI